ncbi:MAG: hypothetical protein GVY07_04765 [Bacteroidetes bacterium]|jgi:uncharacterized iron-regulated membrane protein|nr:hypothetical protein [Bacteroidota bacterium]
MLSNKTLYNIHGWLGLNLGLFLFVVCLSGTFATLSNEVDWLLDPSMRIEASDKPVQWETMYQSLKQAYPDGEVLGIYRNSYSGVESYFATTAYVATPKGNRLKVYLNPYTGKIQGDSGFFNVQRFFRTYHRRFFDGNRGIVLVTLSSFFLLFSVLTGFLFYKGWFKNLFQLRLKSGIKKLWSDLHKLIGIWSLIFALIIALTGAFYFIELIFLATDNYDILMPQEPESIELEERSEFGHSIELHDLDTYVDSATAAFPELEVYTLTLPETAGDYVYLDGQAGNPLTRNRANKVYLHPVTSEVVHIQKSDELNAAEWITDAVDPLHFGYFGELFAKIVWFLFGLALSFSILSGTYIWYIRNRQKAKRSRYKQNPKSRLEKKPLRIKMAVSKFFSTARGAVFSTSVVLLYLFVTTFGLLVDDAEDQGIKSYGPYPENRTVNIDRATLGPWSALLRCIYPCTISDGTLSLEFKEEGIPNYKSVHLQLILESEKAAEIPFKGSAKKPSLQGSSGITLDRITGFEIEIQSVNGEIFSHVVPVEKFKNAKNLLNNRFEQPPKRAMPEIPLGVAFFILFFTLCTSVVLVIWTRMLVKQAFMSEQ